MPARGVDCALHFPDPRESSKGVLLWWNPEWYTFHETSLHYLLQDCTRYPPTASLHNWLTCLEWSPHTPQFHHRDNLPPSCVLPFPYTLHTSRKTFVWCPKSQGSLASLFSCLTASRPCLFHHGPGRERLLNTGGRLYGGSQLETNSQQLKCVFIKTLAIEILILRWCCGHWKSFWLKLFSEDSNNNFLGKRLHYQ